AEDGIRDDLVTGVQTCALPIWAPVLGFLKLLYLDHQLALPRSAQLRAPSDVIVVREAGSFARPGLDHDLAFKRSRSGRRERNADHAVLFCPRNPDPHSLTTTGPRPGSRERLSTSADAS